MVEARRLIPNIPTTRHSLVVECPDVYLDDHAMCLKFSPVENVLACGQVTGELRLFSYDEDANNEIMTLTHHTSSVRSVDFAPDGTILYTASSDNSFSVISQGRVEGHLVNAHDEAVNKIIHVENQHVIATGDDDGIVKIWDLR